MDIASRETYRLLAVVLLLLIRQYPVDLAIQKFILRIMRTRRLRVRFLQSLQMLYLFYRNRRLQVARRPRRALKELRKLGYLELRRVKYTHREPRKFATLVAPCLELGT